MATSDRRISNRLPEARSHAVRAADTHAVNRQPAPVNRIRKLEPFQRRQRAGIYRVATQLVAREHGAVDDADACARTRKNRRGHRAGGTRSHDEHIRIW